MDNVNSNWKIWGIVALVVIGFLFILLVGSYNAVMQLKELNEDCFVCPAYTEGTCIDEDTELISKEDYDDCLICSDDAVAVCMWPEDYKEIYGGIK